MYGKPFRPAPGAVSRGKAVDPVVLESLTKSGNSSDGWTLNTSWSGGVAPYTAVASTDPGFEINVTTLGMEMNDSTTSVFINPEDAGMYINVVDGSTISPAVQGRGFDPLPAPMISSVTGEGESPIDSIWWGQTITLHGQYLSPIASENIAYMYDLPVKGISSHVPNGSLFADSVSFLVPGDARAFPAGVSTYGKWKGDYDIPWVYMVPPNLGPFPGITGLAWAPETGRIWIAAPGGVAESDLFVMDPQLGWTTTDSRFRPGMPETTSRWRFRRRSLVSSRGRLS